MSDLVTAVLTPFDYVVSAPLVAWHEIFSGVLGLGPGWAWALAIVGTAVTVRIVLLPFYLSQLRMRRELRKLEPQIKALEQTYGDDREKLAQEQMKLVRAAGLKPLISLIPLFLLGLVLVVLARMIDAADKHASAGGSFRRGFLTDGDAWSSRAGQDRRSKDHGHAGRQLAERDHGRGRGVDRGHVCRARHRPTSGSDPAAAGASRRSAWSSRSDRSCSTCCSSSSPRSVSSCRSVS